MVEYKIHIVETEKPIHVETIEVADAKADRFFLNEHLEILLACDAADSAGQIQHLNGYDHVVDFALCIEDPSTKELVKIRDLDPQEPQQFSQKEILRMRYMADSVLEEAHFIHTKSEPQKIDHSQQTIATPRMRRIMQSGLSFE